jgi:hypothetical protein
MESIFSFQGPLWKILKIISRRKNGWPVYSFISEFLWKGKEWRQRILIWKGNPGSFYPGSRGPKLLAEILPYRGVYWEPRALPVELYNRIRGREA